MKRISSILLFIIFAFIVNCGGGDKAAADNTAENNTAAVEDNSLQKVKDAGKLVLGLDDTFAPMGFRDENGEVEYIEPTDKEFEIAQKAYEEMMDKLEAEE